MTADNRHARVRIHALGGFRIVVDGRELRLRTRKEAILLLRLAMAGQDGVNRDECLALLWPDSSEARARHSLSEALRGIEQATPLELIRTSERLAVADGSVDLDVAELDRALRAGDVFECARLYVGSFLAGWYPPTAEASHWVDAICATLNRRIETVARSSLKLGVQSTDSDRVLASVTLLDRCGCITEGDREKAIEAEQLANSERERGKDSLQPRVLIDREGPFVGRRAEMIRLTHELDGATKGEVRTIFVSGAAGIGKTRTTQRIARLAALRGARLFLASCYELEQTVPFAAVREAFRTIGPTDVGVLSPVRQAAFRRIVGPIGEIEEAPDDQDMGIRLVLETFSAAFRIACETRSGLLLIDDFQWCDASSCQVIHYLLRAAEPTAGALVILAYREEEIESNPAARALVRSIDNMRLLTIRLGPMTEDEIAAQVQHALGDDSAAIRQVVDMARGNPFHARELMLARQLHPDKLTNESLGEVILRRAAVLSEPDRLVLDVLSVSGSPMGLASAARATGLPSPQLLRSLANLEKSRLIRETPTGFAVSHDITRGAVVGAMGAATKRALHAAIAEAMENSSEPAFAAHHFGAAGIQDKAKSNALRAADDSQSRRAYQEELDWRQTALSFSPNVTAEELRPICDRMFALGRFSEAEHLLRQHAKVLDAQLRVRRMLAEVKASNPAPAPAALLDLCDEIFARSLELELGYEAIDALREKMRIAQEIRAYPLLLFTINQLASFGASCTDRAIGAQARGVAMLKQTAYDPLKVRPSLEKLYSELGEQFCTLPQRVRATVWTVDGLDRLNFGYVSAAGVRFHQVIQEGRANGDLADEIRMRMLLVPVNSEAARFRRAASHAEFVMRHARFANLPWERNVALMNLAVSRWDACDFEGAQAYGLEIIRSAGMHPLWTILAYGLAVLGHVALATERTDEARRIAEELETVLPPIDEWYSDFSPFVTFLVRQKLGVGEQDNALQLLDAATDRARDRHTVAHWTLLLERERTGLSLGGTPSSIVSDIGREAEARGARLVASKANSLLLGFSCS